MPVVVACGSHTSESVDATPLAPAPECEAYVRELRACLMAIGAPTDGPDQLASALGAGDDATRQRMNATCARDRARLAESCK